MTWVMCGSVLAHVLFVGWLHLLPEPPEPVELSLEQSERWVPRLEAQPRLVWAARNPGRCWKTRWTRTLVTAMLARGRGS